MLTVTPVPSAASNHQGKGKTMHTRDPQTRSRQHLMRAALAAALAAGAWTAQAASMYQGGTHEPRGYSVSEAAAERVQVGQTQDEVRAELGRPAQQQHFRGTDTTVWRYDTPASSDSSQVLVEFDTQGAVTAVTRTPAPGG
jgi:outer membrane protein assembly factor BamE (lipoprotein component of BamABCDE complex)